MSRIFTLTVGPLLAIGTACGGPGGIDKTSPSMGLGPPVAGEGTVYTPVSIGPRGCVLYKVRIPGGQAPAALVYQSVDGRFSYDRPERCVRTAKVPLGP